LLAFDHICYCLAGHIQQTLDVQVVGSLLSKEASPLLHNLSISYSILAKKHIHHIHVMYSMTLATTAPTKMSSNRVPWSTLRNSWSHGSMSSVLFSLFSSSSGGGGSSLWWVAHSITCENVDEGGREKRQKEEGGG